MRLRVALVFTLMVAGQIRTVGASEPPTARSTSLESLAALHHGKAGIVTNIRRLNPDRAGRTKPGRPQRADRTRPGRPERAGRTRAPRHAGAERVDLKPLYQSHPLVDAVMLRATWQEVQPTPGSMSFVGLRREVDDWGKAGKGVIISVGLYGQAPNDRLTPSWIYQQPKVRQVTFAGGGVARGDQVRVPAVWDKGFVERFIEPLVIEMARAFDGHTHLWYVMPGFGHIGNMTCQPSAGGSAACLQAGWTPERWMAYCRRVMVVYRKHFKKTPVFILSAGMFLRHRVRDNFKPECSRLLQEFGAQGACVVHFGLEGDRRAMNEVYGNLDKLLPATHRGISRIGLGDDWPLWVPEDRREHGPTRDHGEDNLVRTLENAFGGQAGVPKIPTTILFCHEPEIVASHPNTPDYRGEVHAALSAARKRLKENDRLLVQTAGRRKR